MRSGSTGRLRSAICTERRSLSRSNGTRRPLRLMTASSRSCPRSKVGKRKLQAKHTRRRRMTELSSVGRESFTCVSRLPQFGQRMTGSIRTTADRRSRTDVGPFCPPSSVLCHLSVDRKSADEPLYPFAHGGFDRWIGLHVLLPENI